MSESNINSTALIFLVFFVTGVLVVFFGDDSSSGSSVSSSSASWHIGGNLHTATVFQWKNASESNKLATCGDWIAAWEKNGLTRKTYPNIDSVKPDSIQLRACLNIALDSAWRDEKINEYAVLCAAKIGIIQM